MKIKSTLGKVGVATALALALASCMAPPAPTSSSTGTTVSQLADAKTLTQADKAFLTQLKANSYSSQALINHYNTQRNPYVKNEILIKLIASLTSENKYDAAKYYVKAYTSSTDARQNTQYNYLVAKLGQLTNDPELLSKSNNIDTSKLEINEQVSAAKLSALNSFNAGNYDQGLNTINAAYARVNDQYKLELVNFVVDRLGNVAPSTLENLAQKSTSSINTGWYRLALITTNSANNAQALASQYNAWKQTYAQYRQPAALTTPNLFKQTTAAVQTQYKYVTVLLPFDGNYTVLSNAIRAGIDQANVDMGKVATVSYLDTSKESIESAITRASEGSDIIIGPLKQEDLLAANQLNLKVPEIMLNAVDTYNPKACYFNLRIEEEGTTIANVMRQLKVRQPIIISDNTSSSIRAANAFATAWLNLKQQNVQTMTFNSGNIATQARNLLARNPQPDAVLFLGNPENLLNFNSALNFASPNNKIKIFATNKSNNESLNGPKLADLKNVYFTDSSIIGDANSSLAKKANKEISSSYVLRRLYAFGYDAFKLAQNYNALRTVDNYTVSGVTGKFIIPSGNRCVINNYYNVYQVVDGQFLKIN
ncbi:penicillin-binding protein activator [Psittacicella hinzii]|uniref:Penicillin-binding protein activator LpoA n=1 Tax=Psittacicella hinzii TaxID=2028575 RepID=A0A3A1YFJ0_9GAMM|nr:penicillin-binding protein activator [Psittacicella hinzii]RIY34994.1 hypothetical protein CKF58_07275 [Psittacicella hinzii]